MKKEKIEVVSRNIGAIGRPYYHQFILYTDKKGDQWTTSGWAESSPRKGSPFTDSS